MHETQHGQRNDSITIWTENVKILLLYSSLKEIHNLFDYFCTISMEKQFV